jgi:phage terminase small subunit
MTANSELTLKQESFCRFYLETGNASEAYRRAYDASGMQDTTINRNACELLKNNKIATRVAELQAQLAERHNITADKIVVELAAIGFSNMADYIVIGSDGGVQVDLSELTRKQAAAIGEITVDEREYGQGENAGVARKTRFKLLDKRGALVDLGKHLGLFKEVYEHTGKDGTPLLAPEPSRRDLARAVLAILSSAKLEES